MQRNIRILLFIGLLIQFSCTDNRASESPSAFAVIGGQDASRPYAFFVSLTESFSDGGEDALCSGTHIAPGFVVTAAHCVVGYESMWGMGLSFEENIEVLFNQGHYNNLGKKDDGLTRSKVLKTLVHPGYFANDLHSSDIALIQYKLNAFAKSEVPEIAKLPNLEEEPGNSFATAVVIGFGVTNVKKDLRPTQLQEAIVQNVDHDVCSNINDPIYEGLPDSFICFGDFEQGKVDACVGDSGGPLFSYNAVGDPVLIGITSFGPQNDCGVAGKPGVYTNVAYFKDWIEESLADAANWN